MQEASGAQLITGSASITLQRDGKVVGEADGDVIEGNGDPC